jgi:hypothetical protein
MKQWFFIKVGFLVSLLALTACTLVLPETGRVSHQNATGCPNNSVEALRNCITAVRNAQWVDAYTLGKLR